ncbi:MAG: hypothetical protein FWD35_00600 [Oscillospiraceae bacterium]|nr:hypothetical protein [Oscillospiraceae bacterium]
MIRELLSPKDCAQCRGCCIFAEHELWEAPETAFPLVPRGEYFACRHLTEQGCELGENKPRDCAMYPFRVMSLDSSELITVSRFCKPVNALPLSTLTEFADKKAAEFRGAGCAIKAYNREYVILKVLED